MDPKFKRLKPISNDDLVLLQSLTKQTTPEIITKTHELNEILNLLKELKHVLQTKLPQVMTPTTSVQQSVWTPQNHRKFLELQSQQMSWQQMHELLKPLTIQQIRSHNQKFQVKLQRVVKQIGIPRTDGIHALFASYLGIVVIGDRIIFDDSQLIEKKAGRIDSYSDSCQTIQHEMRLPQKTIKILDTPHGQNVAGLIGSLVISKEPAQNWDLCVMIQFQIEQQEAREIIANVLYESLK
ncbi:hypothetical protein SS50377_22385 [Spironucleus salmonicida]|uniref:Uncharacterized protein n=1 Tax=Spironucleus salmonicida TaxID=348837 RepID=V6LC88_9EUKA|nr:hypothetical protein SS50377_22385 [Spironucleus salmonicida]|eukprot:EST42120.1 hypothetical protein SS50377_18429 [Spironucleus salmonicida]